MKKQQKSAWRKVGEGRETEREQEPELPLVFRSSGCRRLGLTLRAAAGRGGPQPWAQRAAAGSLQTAPALQLEGDAPSGRLGLEA